jgi:hypothetical protein
LSYPLRSVQFCFIFYICLKLFIRDTEYYLEVNNRQHTQNALEIYHLRIMRKENDNTQNLGTKYNQTQIEGTVLLQFLINTNDDNNTSFLATMDSFQGLPPYCEQCPISIQERMTCGEDGIGSHYFSHSTMESDPWTKDCGVYFITNSRGMGIKHSFFLDIGHGYLETKGHAVLVKGPDHSCSPCGILSSNKPQSTSSSSSAIL